MGDERTYEHPVALRAVTSTDAMTADWAHLPYDFMAKVSNEIINKVKGVNRVCYDISSKPPSTIGGNKQNKKSPSKRATFLFLFLVLQEITYFHEKFFFIAWLRSLRSFCRFFLFLLLGNLVHHLDEHEDTEGNDEEVETGLEEVTVVDG